MMLYFYPKSVKKSNKKFLLLRPYIVRIEIFQVCGKKKIKKHCFINRFFDLKEKVVLFFALDKSLYIKESKLRIENCSEQKSTTELISDKKVIRDAKENCMIEERRKNET